VLADPRHLAICVTSRGQPSNGVKRTCRRNRLATLEWASGERGAAIAEVRRELAEAMEALRGERVVVIDDVRHIVDVILLRVAMFLVAAVVLAPMVAHVYARVWPRRWREPQK
jgi:hypothetical protein